MLELVLIQGSQRVLKVMEIDGAFFPGPGKFWKRKVFQIGYGKILDFCLGKF